MSDTIYSFSVQRELLHAGAQAHIYVLITNTTKEPRQVTSAELILGQVDPSGQIQRLCDGTPELLKPEGSDWSATPLGDGLHFTLKGSPLKVEAGKSFQIGIYLTLPKNTGVVPLGVNVIEGQSRVELPAQGMPIVAPGTMEPPPLVAWPPSLQYDASVNKLLEVALSWEAPVDTTLSIEGDDGSKVPTSEGGQTKYSGTVTLTPVRTTVYSLTAKDKTNGKVRTQSQVTVTVHGSPTTVERFQATMTGLAVSPATKNVHGLKVSFDYDIKLLVPGSIPQIVQIIDGADRTVWRLADNQGAPIPTGKKEAIVELSSMPGGASELVFELRVTESISRRATVPPLAPGAILGLFCEEGSPQYVTAYGMNELTLGGPYYEGSQTLTNEKGLFYWVAKFSLKPSNRYPLKMDNIQLTGKSVFGAPVRYTGASPTPEAGLLAASLFFSYPGSEGTTDFLLSRVSTALQPKDPITPYATYDAKELVDNATMVGLLNFLWNNNDQYLHNKHKYSPEFQQSAWGPKRLLEQWCVENGIDAGGIVRANPRMVVVAALSSLESKGMRYPFGLEQVECVNRGLVEPLTTTWWSSLEPAATMPVGWRWHNIGPLTGGSVIVGPDDRGQEFTLTAREGDVWNKADAFSFVYFEYRAWSSRAIQAVVMSQERTHEWAKAGLMFRESLDPSSRFFWICVTPGNSVVVHARLVTGGEATWYPPEARPGNFQNGGTPIELSLSYDPEAGEFKAREFRHGAWWSGVRMPNPPKAWLVGLGVSANNEYSAKATFRWGSNL